MAMAEAATLAVNLTLNDRQFAAGLRRTQTGLNGLGRNFARVGTGIGKVGSGLVRAGERIALVLGAGFVYAAKKASDFEAQMSTINTIAQKTGTAFTGQLGAIGEGILNLSARGGNLADLTAGYYDILSAGITNTVEAQSVLNKAWELGRGSLGTTAEGVDVLTTAINSYRDSGLYAGKTTEQLATMFGDQIAKAVELGKLKLTDIGSTFADVAPIAANAGIGLDQIAAAYGTITAKGSAAGEVSTQMSRAIIELIKPSADLEKLQKKLGKNYADIAREKGLVPALQQIRKDAKASGIPFEELFGRLEGLRFVISTTGVNFANYQKILEKVRNSSGTLDKQVSARNKGLAYAFDVLRANVDLAAITLAKGYTPALERLADKATVFFQDKKNKAAIEGLGKEIGAFIDKIDFGQVVDGAKTLFGYLRSGIGIVKTLVDAFLLLPGPLKEGAVGLAVLNKLSGGLIGAGLGDIFAGLGGAAVKSIFSRIPFIGGLAATPVRVVNWPPGFGMGAGGAAGGLKGFLTRAGGGLGALLGGGVLTGLAAIAAAGTGLVAVLTAVQKLIVEPKLQQEAGENIADVQAVIARGNAAEIASALSGIKAGINNLDPLQRALYELNADGVKVHTESLIAALTQALADAQDKSRTNLQPLPDDLTKKERRRYNRQRAEAEENRINRALVPLPPPPLRWKPSDTVQVEDRRGEWTAMLRETAETNRILAVSAGPALDAALAAQKAGEAEANLPLITAANATKTAVIASRTATVGALNRLAAAKPNINVNVQVNGLSRVTTIVQTGTTLTRNVTSTGFNVRPDIPE